MLIQIFVWLFYAYLGIGLLLGFWLVFRGMEKIDTGLEGSKWWLRLLLLPGTIGLWPLLLYKVLTNKNAEI